MFTLKISTAICEAMTEIADPLRTLVRDQGWASTEADDRPEHPDLFADRPLTGHSVLFSKQRRSHCQ